MNKVIIDVESYLRELHTLRGETKRALINSATIENWANLRSLDYLLHSINGEITFVKDLLNINKKLKDDFDHLNKQLFELESENKDGG